VSALLFPPNRLLTEVRAVEEAAQELRGRLQDAQTRLAQLIETRGHLESEIRVKRHSLHVDELQCRDIRATFPSTLDISG
jgi:Tektin family